MRWELHRMETPSGYMAGTQTANLNIIKSEVAGKMLSSRYIFNFKGYRAQIFSGSLWILPLSKA